MMVCPHTEKYANMLMIEIDHEQKMIMITKVEYQYQKMQNAKMQHTSL